ncbi:DinB family protein [Aggregatilinea lenta]|uniref:DinB family protein n=1 Tax=Aggregatilinea lenta TaxID=913108 RepID=UPI000E5AA70D|nr:DinB family protein [Aggregatilinea lenta]
MTDRTPTWGDTIVHLLALASRMEGEGYYNVAKLLRASADATLRRTAYRLNLPTGLSNLHGDVARALGELAALSCGPDVLDALKAGQAALKAGRLPLIEEMPNPFVCRTCGMLLVEPPTERCPVCGAWPESFQEFMPNYWFNALDPFQAVERLRTTPGEVAALMDGMSEDAMNRQPAPGEWSVRQVVTHLHDAQKVLFTRIDLLMTQDYPSLASQAVFEWAGQETARPATTRDIYAEYIDLRGEILTRLEGIALKDWWRTGYHEEFGDVTLRQQVSYFTAHETVHLPQIAALRDAFGGE